MGDLFHNKVVDSFVEAVFDIMVGSPQHTFFVLTKRPERMGSFIRTHFPGIANAKHIWLGVTVENQEAADDRIERLRYIPAAKRFISFEPLLSEVVVGRNIKGSIFDRWKGIGWAIVGGESGFGARPMHLDWARSLKDQCQMSGTPFFFKQHGTWLHDSQVTNQLKILPACMWDDGSFFYKVGKHRAGHLLDGKEWREFPK